MALRVVFMGTPEFSVPTLAEIVGQGHEVVACYSQPPRPAGRGMAERKSPVHEKAEALGIPVLTPKSLKGDAEQAAFAAHDADIAVVVAYGLLLPKAILDAPREGCYNGHASLLPRWRGAAPIQRAIMAGDTETGMIVMKMDEGLDTGDMAMAEKIAITPDMTAGELHDLLAQTGGDLMARALGAVERGTLQLVPQSHDGVTYASKISKDETRIDWNQPAAQVHNHIRGLSPFPGAWCEMDLNGKATRVKILRSMLRIGNGKPSGACGEILAASASNLTIACKEGSVNLVRLQKSGKQAVDTDAFLRGAVLKVGAKLI